MNAKRVEELKSLIHTAKPEASDKAIDSALAPVKTSSMVLDNALKIETDPNAKVIARDEDYGKQLAIGYVTGMATMAGTWAQGILHLCEVGTPASCEAAMKAALLVSKAQADEQIAVSLAKRISEARRVFKAYQNNAKDTLKVLKGKGSWHAKVTALPKATNAGRPTGQGAGKTTTPVTPGVADNPVSTLPEDNAKMELAIQSALGKDVTDKQAAPVIAAVKKVVAQWPIRHTPPSMEDCLALIRKMNFGQLRKVSEVTLFLLCNSSDKDEAQAAKDCQEIFAKADNKAILETSQVA